MRGTRAGRHVDKQRPVPLPAGLLASDTAQMMLSGRRRPGPARLRGPSSCSKNKNKLSDSGESQDFEREERPQEPQDMCYWVK